MPALAVGRIAAGSCVSEAQLELLLGLGRDPGTDEGGFANLAALHRSLDEAVAAAYGWPKSVAQDPEQIVSRLTALNREIVEGGRTYDPFAGAAADRAGELRAGTS